MIACSTRLLWRLGSLLPVSFALIACGGGSGSNSSTVSPYDDEYVDTDFSVISKDELMGLSLTGGQTFSATVDSCLSGFSRSDLDETSTEVKVLKNDKGCMFKLTAFAIDTETFPVSGKNYSEGQTFTVTGTEGTELEFTVAKNFDNPIASAQTISIIYGVAQKGVDSNVDHSVAYGIDISGASPIGLEVAAVALDIDGTDGAGLFTVSLECDATIAGSDCEGVDLATVKMNLAKDTTSGVLDMTGCLALANAGATGTVLAAGTSGVANGGVQTTEVKGPAPLFGDSGNNANVLLAVADGTDACKYYEITILLPN